MGGAVASAAFLFLEMSMSSLVTVLAAENFEENMILTNLNLTRSGIHHRTVLRGAYYLFNMWNLGFRRFHPLVVTRDRDGVALPRLGRLFAPGGDALLEEAVVGAARVPRLGQKGQIPPRSEN